MFFAPYVLSVAVLTLIWAFLLNPSLGLVGVVGDWFGAEPDQHAQQHHVGDAGDRARHAVVDRRVQHGPVPGRAAGHRHPAVRGGFDRRRQRLAVLLAHHGARPQRTFRLVVVLQVIYSFQIFGQVFIMTRGGPDGATRVLIQHVFERGFRDFQLGYASAMSIFLFLVIIAVSVVQFLFLSGGEDEA
jgi:multiple sugar transport system permease protein